MPHRLASGEGSEVGAPFRPREGWAGAVPSLRTAVSQRACPLLLELLLSHRIYPDARSSPNAILVFFALWLGSSLTCHWVPKTTPGAAHCYSDSCSPPTPLFHSAALIFSTISWCRCKYVSLRKSNPLWVSSLPFSSWGHGISVVAQHTGGDSLGKEQASRPGG